MRPFLVLLAAAICCAPAVCLAEEIACPASITETPMLGDAPQGWRILATKGERPLDTAGLNSGDPADMASLVPDDATSANGIASDIWNLAANDEYWVACSYAGTSAQLFRKVPASAKTCTATYTLMGDGQRDQLKSVSCE